MAIENEELMGKLVRTGMIMRHIDGAGPRCHKHGPHGHHHGHGEGPCHHHGPAPEEAPVSPEGSERSYGCDHGPGHGPGRHGHGPKGGCHRGQARVLTAVALKEGINQKELAFVLGIRPQTLGAMLQKLEDRGMVVRTKSATDGRAIEVALTDEGRERAAKIAERRAVAAADMFAVLTDEEKEQLSGILDKLTAELDKHRPHRCCKKHGEADEAAEAEEATQE